jgi:hypothetical protein
MNNTKRDKLKKEKYTIKMNIKILNKQKSKNNYQP